MRVTTASARRVVVQAASVSLLCMLAYRCVRQLRENSVTVYVTELVRLPPAATTLPAAMTTKTTTARTKTKNDKATAADSDDDSHQTSTAAAFAAAAALTTQSSSSSRHHHRRHRHGSAAAAAALVLTTVAVEGVVEVRTRLTRGYCFALKLCASWAEQDDMSVYGSDSAAAITAAAASSTTAATGASATRHGSRGRRRHRASVSRNSNNSNRHTVPTYSLRRRAVQTAAAVMRRPHTPVVPALARAIRRDSDSDSDGSHNDDDSSSSSDGSNNSSDDDDTRVSSPLPSAATTTTTAQQGRHGRASRAHVAVLRALRVHAMVDRYELAEKGLLCFAPACVSSTTLLAYCTSARIALPHRQPHTTAAAAAAAQAATVIVHGCYLQADGSTPTAQRLSLDVRFTGALHDVQVQLTLPHARCRVRCAYTCGVGTLRQRIDGMSAARCIWQLGDVDENTCRDNATHGDGGAVASGRNNNNNELYTTTAAAHAARTHDADAVANIDDALALHGAAASLQHARERVCHFVLVYEPPTTNDNDDDDDNTDEVATAAASADDDDDNSSSSDVVGSDNDDDATAATATATQASSSRARKRAARAQQRRRVHERQQRLRAGLVAGSGSGRRDGSEASRLPRVELRYRVPTLASGAVVRRLQVLEQHTDDDCSSDADKTRSTPPLLLRRLLSWLCHRRTSAAATATVTQQRQHGRLTKLAHYTTCYVQPIVVTPL